MIKFWSQYSSPIGELYLSSDGNNLTGISYLPYHDNLIRQDSLKIFVQTKSWLNDYFLGKPVKFQNLPCSFTGNDFQKHVWNEISKIPYGHSITYGDIAKTFKRKMSAQAIGHAVGQNPLVIIIPCHRVLGKKNTLTGYGGGLERKKFLLNLEGIDFKS